MQKKNLRFIELLLYISRHKKFVLITVLIASIAAVIYSLVTTQYWRSNATFIPTDNDNLFGVAAISDIRSTLFSSGVQPASAELIMIMKSDRFSKKVLKEFALYDYFKLFGPDSLRNRDEAIEKLHSRIIKFSLDEETGLISVSALTRNKHLSADIANYYCKILSEYNKDTRKTKSKETREFLEKRVMSIEQEIDSLSVAMNTFQKKYNVLNIEVQTQKIIELYSELISNKIIAELHLDILKIQVKDDTPEIVNLTNEIKSYNEKISELEYLDSNIPKYILKMDKIPDIMLQLSNFKMNIQILTSVYEFLYPQLESAKLEELREVRSIEIIDKAEPAGKRAKPKRALLCIITFILALIFSVLVSIIIELYKDYIASNDNSQILSEIKNNLFKK